MDLKPNLGYDRYLIPIIERKWHPMTAAKQTNTFSNGPDENGHFGIFGGRYVAETLMPIILEVE